MLTRVRGDTAADHPALAADQEFGALLRADAQQALHRQREQRRLRQLLAAGAWGFSSSAGITLVRPLPWDQAHFGYPCADLVRFYFAPSCRDRAAREADELVAATLEECRQRGIVLLSARLPAAQIVLAQSLERAGMALVDTSVELGTRLPLLPTAPVEGVAVRAPQSRDRMPLMEIARSFRGNRFHQDPRIPRHRATEVYACWVVSAMEGDHGRLLLAEISGQVAGITTYTPGEDELGVGTVALVVIAPEFRGRRVIDPLMAGCAQVLAGEGDTVMVTSTQVSNGPALRAFGRHGLLPHGARHIFHGWL